MKWSGIKDLEVRLYREMAVGLGSIVLEGPQGRMGEMRFTNVFLKRQGRWQMAAAHLGPRQERE